MEKIFQDLRVRLKFSTRQAMKIKLFVAREIQYFKLGIFSFNSYVHYLTRAFNLLTRAFYLPTHAFNLATRGFELVTREFELVTRVLLFHQKKYMFWFLLFILQEQVLGVFSIFSKFFIFMSIDENMTKFSIQLNR